MGVSGSSEEEQAPTTSELTEGVDAEDHATAQRMAMIFAALELCDAHSGTIRKQRRLLNGLSDTEFWARWFHVVRCNTRFDVLRVQLRDRAAELEARARPVDRAAALMHAAGTIIPLATATEEHPIGAPATEQTVAL